MRKQTARNMSTTEMFTVEWQPISTDIPLDQGPCNIHRPLWQLETSRQYWSLLQPVAKASRVFPGCDETSHWSQRARRLRFLLAGSQSGCREWWLLVQVPPTGSCVWQHWVGHPRWIMHEITKVDDLRLSRNIFDLRCILEEVLGDECGRQSLSVLEQFVS